MNTAQPATGAMNVDSYARVEGSAAGTDRLLRLPQVLDMVGLGKTMLYEMIKTGEFPQPRKVRHLSVWVESEVQTWISKIAKVPAELE
ncbi:transcriptional regulator, AlpA family [Burkholderia sp. GAS332]|nr:transcriptional regulator, AlpA family [Burkholderia sp. GAS332]